MNALLRVLLPVALALTTLSPLGNADAGYQANPAHPDVHKWVGTGDQRVQVGAEGQLRAYVYDLCANVEPFIHSITPPELGRDSDDEAGVGGACFTFVSERGDATGLHLHPQVQWLQFTRPLVVNQLLSLSCVDMDADGQCERGIDEMDLCRYDHQGDISVWTGEPCRIYANPAAADKTVYVLILTSVGGSPVVGSAALAGYAILPAFIE
ncbi:MAG TPA: hypothetical protein VNX21_06290 [Candidatus Thermoplasmatota archaeon]|nr:hypothetical protein [Candidatus Thermoplasmatota archaeon]